VRDEVSADVVSLWGPQNGPRPVPNPVNDACFADLRIEASATIAATPDAVWDLLADPTRIGELSPECIAGRWIEGSTRPTVGSRFEGTNRMVLSDGSVYEWVRPCTVTTADRPHAYGYLSHDRWNHPACEWAFALERTAPGCRVRQTWHHLPDALSGLRLQLDADPTAAPSLLEWRLQALRQGIEATLGRLRALLNG
jgi:uncharacterized protein YndB with AHSA1/START domain